MSRLFVLFNIDKKDKGYLKIQPNGGGYNYTEDLRQASTFTWEGARNFWRDSIRDKSADRIFAMELGSSSVHHLATQITIPDEDTGASQLVLQGSEQKQEELAESLFNGKIYPRGQFTIKSADIKINQQKLVELNKQYEFEYDNSELIEKTRSLIDAYNDFFDELEKHRTVDEFLSCLELTFDDIKHITEFSKLSAVSSYALLSFQQKLLRSRRMAKDSKEILLKTGGLEEQKIVVEHLKNFIDTLDTRYYNFRTDILEDVIEDTSVKHTDETND